MAFIEELKGQRRNRKRGGRDEVESERPVTTRTLCCPRRGTLRTPMRNMVRLARAM